MSSVLPNVIYVGYMRAGSTYLRGYFSAHPQIQWTRKAWYFQLGRDDDHRRRIYRRFFDSMEPGGCLIDVYEGLTLSQYFKNQPAKDYTHRESPEWSPEWAMCLDGNFQSGPIAADPAEMARRIGQCVGDVKILIVLRNQDDWLRSVYLHYLEYLPEGRRGFGDFLSTLEGKCALGAGLFDQTLLAYFDVFGRSSVHVMLLEEIAREEQDVFHDLCRFLDVDYFLYRPEPSDRNVGRGDPTPLLHGRLIGKLAGLWPKHRDVFTKSEKTMIRAFYSGSNAKCATLLDRDLSRYGYNY